MPIQLPKAKLIKDFRDMPEEIYKRFPGALWYNYCGIHIVVSYWCKDIEGFFFRVFSMRDWTEWTGETFDQTEGFKTSKDALNEAVERIEDTIGEA